MPGICNNTRGFSFSDWASTAWKQKGYYRLKVEEYLGTAIEGDYGFDTGKLFFHTQLLLSSMRARNQKASRKSGLPVFIVSGAWLLSS
jgi:hypothetical protein